METLSPVANEIANWLRQTREAMPGFAEDCVRGDVASAVFFVALFTGVAVVCWAVALTLVMRGLRRDDDDTFGAGLFVAAVVTAVWVTIFSANASTYIHATWGPRAYFVAECLRK